MDTKLRGDIAEQQAILDALRRGWGVSIPVGDRLSYDLIFDTGAILVRIQVKHAWFSEKRNNHVVDTRRTKTNRRNMIRSHYSKNDFDVALVYLQEHSLFYVFPVEVFISFGSEIHMNESFTRQRLCRSAPYKEAWHVISKWAAPIETLE